ncbi:MAG TPA: hypothetical protein VNE39_24335 [Planctomycetota bacterium]|nr:hypothetical protein [Planctomycetota bacterium]
MRSGVALALLMAMCAEGAMVKLTVEEPSGVERKGWPVTSGVPFAQGALRDPSAMALYASDGAELPLQTEALARWPDGSVRWLLLDFQVDLAPKQKAALTLRHGPGTPRSEVQAPLRIRREAGATHIEAGPLAVSFLAGQGELTNLAEFRLDKGGSFCLRSSVRDEADRVYVPFLVSAGPWDVVVEQSGPMRACVRLEGAYRTRHAQLFRYVVRIHAFRGQPFVRLFHTFINDRQDALMAGIRSLELSVGPKAETERKLALLNGQSSEGGCLVEVDDTVCEVNGRPAGKRAAGWAAVQTQDAGVALGLREFWQNWPKSLEVDGSELRVGLCPEFPKGLYDGKPLEEENKLYYHLRGGGYSFKVGVARTHELWALFSDGAADARRLAAFFQASEDPLLATCEPAYVSSTKAAGDFPPADPAKFAGYDAWLSRALDAHLARREKGREFGMLNYGDWYGERKVNWGNLEYDLQHGLFLQYLRTGDRRFFLRAEQAARHHIDVDVAHATNPHLKNPWGRPPEIGDIWLHCLNHTGGYYDEKTSGLPVARTYHMGHSTNYGHVWVAGDLDYYYLTGDRRAREVALQVADTMARHCPTAYSDHIRGLGWPIILVLAAYDATLDKKYLDAATACWEVLKKNFDWQKGWVVRLAKGHCLHDDRRCYGNVPFMEGLTLCALARYHRITKDPEVLKAISVGIDQMIRECWMEEVKAFRYTPCPLTKPTPYTTLAAEAMAYEVALTGNKEHLRILREGLRAVFEKTGGDFGKGLAQIIHFTPHALAALDD